MNIYLKSAASCGTCNFTSADIALLVNHSCDVQAQGGSCEDFPACGHERGDCNGLLYGSDESIKAQVHEAWATGHGYCDHAEGIYNCDGDDEEYECDDESHACDSCDGPGGVWENGDFVPHAGAVWHCSNCDRPCPEGAHED